MSPVIKVCEPLMKVCESPHEPPASRLLGWISEASNGISYLLAKGVGGICTGFTVNT
jgi:hypothetical protein